MPNRYLLFGKFRNDCFTIFGVIKKISAAGKNRVKGRYFFNNCEKIILQTFIYY